MAGNVQFQFNLLPKTSKEEIKEIKKRDESTIYGFLLLFFGVFIFLALNIVQAGIVKPRIKVLDNKIKNLETEVSNHRSLIVSNGELVRKAQLLEEPLKLDIKINDFLNISDRTFGIYGTITSYDRDARTGDFLVTVTTASISNIIDMITSLKTNTDILNSKVLSVSLLSDNTFSVVIQFKINIIEAVQTNATGT